MIDVIYSSLGSFHTPISDSSDLKFLFILPNPFQHPSKCFLLLHLSYFIFAFLGCFVTFFSFLSSPTLLYSFFFFNLHLVKAMVFPEVMYECESWTIKKAEC